MKIAPIHRAFLQEKRKKEKIKSNFIHLICHTGQHYDESMSEIFFNDLELPKPDVYLGVGSGSHAEQTARIMIEFEKVLEKEKPDLIIVVGDVNSTIACSLAASKMGINIAHVEAGLRSFDRTMPEEINRLLTDAISDFLFVSEKSGLENLKREGIHDEKVFFVGNVMIDSLIHYSKKVNAEGILNQLELAAKSYILITLHRPSNVDNIQNLTGMMNLLNELSNKIKVVFPVHPRTKKNIEAYNLERLNENNLILTEPLGYLDFISLLKNAALVLTDSGGIQEETTFLGVQCITIRDNTERPVTVEIGTNHLAGTDLNKVKSTALNILSGNIKSGKIPELWDGKTADRIVEIILYNLS